MPTETDLKLSEDLSAFRVEVAKEFGAVRTEMAEQFGVVNGALGRIEERIEHSLSLAKWSVGILIPIVVTLIGGAFWLTWQAAKLDSRVERIEQAVKIDRPSATKK